MATSVHSPVSALQPSASRPTLKVVLVEDDPGDALLVETFLEESADPWDLVWVKSLAEATRVVNPQVSCVLIDLGLPDTHGFEALIKVLELAKTTAVIVLTGLDDEQRAAEAVAAGAQDYLIKGRVDSEILARSIRYAIERKQAERTSMRLREAEQRRAHNERLERGLLPRPVIHDERLQYVMRYRPGSGNELGGDFLDLIELPDGVVRMVIGDVAGHGPDEAALGVRLRAAWRALVLARHPINGLYDALERMVRAERNNEEVFVTCCDITISADHKTAYLRSAGHPPPMLLGSEALYLDQVSGPALGIVDFSVEWPVTEHVLPDTWALLVYTDGLIETSTNNGNDRLGYEGLHEITRQLCPRSTEPSLLLESLLSAAEDRNGKEFDDDVAVLLLSNKITG